MNNLFIVDMP